MTKLLTYRATATALLITFGILLAACGQQSATSSTSPVVSTAVVTTAASSTAVGNTPASSPVADDTAAGNAADSGAAADNTPVDVVSAEATATVLASGISDAPQAGLDLTKLDPCTLLTADDVKSAMGDAPYAPRQMSQESYHTACSYVEPTLEVNSPRLFLSLDPVETWELVLPSAEPVAGVGDDARTANFNGWRTLSVLLKNKVVVGIDIYPPDVEKAKQLVSKVIGRLP